MQLPLTFVILVTKTAQPEAEIVAIGTVILFSQFDFLEQKPTDRGIFNYTLSVLKIIKITHQGHLLVERVIHKQIIAGHSDLHVKCEDLQTNS